MDSSSMFEKAIDWLIENYEKFNFYKERDIVWTMQKKITEMIRENNLPYKVYEDYPIMPGTRRSISVDLAILEKDSIHRQGNTIEVAAEFKYEPDHSREDMLTFFFDEQDNRKTKFPLCFWKEGIVKDIEKAKQYFELNLCRNSYSCFIDEGRYFRYNTPFDGSEWKDYQINSKKISLLWFKQSLV